MPSAVDERPDDELADDEAGPVGIHLGDRVVGGVGVQVRLAPVGIGLHEATEGRAVVAGVHVQQPEAQLVVPLDVELADVQVPEAEVADAVVGGRSRADPRSRSGSCWPGSGYRRC